MSLLPAGSENAAASLRLFDVGAVTSFSARASQLAAREAEMLSKIPNAVRPGGLTSVVVTDFFPLK